MIFTKQELLKELSQRNIEVEEFRSYVADVAAHILNISTAVSRIKRQLLCGVYNFISYDDELFLEGIIGLWGESLNENRLDDAYGWIQDIYRDEVEDFTFHIGNV